MYATKPGYDPAKRLAWADLDLEHPVAKATDPVPAGGFSTFTGTLPERSGRHPLYAVWQRSDSPEAFYSCSDVDFGGDGGASAPAPSASAPSGEQIAAGAGRSTIEHHGHGDDDARTSAEPAAAGPAERPAPADRPESQGGSWSPTRLAETGASAGTSSLAIGGAAVRRRWRSARPRCSCRCGGARRTAAGAGEAPGPVRRLRPDRPRGRLSRGPRRRWWGWRGPGRGRWPPRGRRSGRTGRSRGVRTGRAGRGPGAGRCGRPNRSGTGCARG
ncbi:GlcNAc-binding protein A [Streptomyces sp. enrichment culture]